MFWVFIIFSFIIIVIFMILLIFFIQNEKAENIVENQDCELSNWREVGDCQPSDISGHYLGQIRLERNIIKPQKGTGKACEALTSTTLCSFQDLCTSVPITPGVWTPNDETCQEGQNQTTMISLSKPNVTNRESGCTGTYLLSRPCSSAPVNCVVSEYGPCINKIQKRFVLIKDRNGGQDCPSLIKLCS